MAVLCWDYRLDFDDFDKRYNDIELFVNGFGKRIIEIIEDGVKILPYNLNADSAPNQDGDLKTSTENNKQLRHAIDKRLEEYAKQQSQCETLKENHKLLSQEIKEKHEAFLMTKKFYKRFLKIYYSFESQSEGHQTIFLQFFTEVKKDSKKYSIRLSRNTKTGHYSLIETYPKLNSFKEFQRKLEKTNDMPSLLCSLRQAFIQHATKKH